jgi:DNA-binding CsgD family transcriptional regulator
LPAPPDLAGGAGATSQAALFAAAREYLAGLATPRPVILLLDDLHWADPASLDLLRVLARDLAALPLLLVATYRSDELTRRHPLYQLLPLLVREAHAARLDLHALDDAGMRGLVEHYALPPADAGRLVAYLRERAEGNPFYAGELLRALEEASALRRERDAGWMLGDLAGAGVPPLLRQVIDTRVDRLGDAVHALLAVGAVIGQEVPLGLWAATAGADEEALLDAAERAAEARLVASSAAGLRFAHALIREALYESVLPLRRRAIHRRAAEALAAMPDPDPDAVAHHFRQAGDDRAAGWLERAAERARRAYSWPMAADRLEAAVAHLERPGGDLAARGWLLLRLGLLRRHIDRPAALALLAAASELAVLDGDPLLGAYARFTAGLVRCYRFDLRAGVADMEAAVAALDALPPPNEETRARLRGWGLADDPDHQRGTLALWYAYTGRLADALALGEPVAARGVASGPAWLDGAFAPDALRGLGLAHAAQGRPDEARAALERNAAAYHTAGDHGQVAATLRILLREVYLTYWADDLAGRRRVLAEAMAAQSRAAGNFAPLVSRLAAASVTLVEGHWAEAQATVAAAATLRLGDAGGVQKVVVALSLARWQGDRAAARAAVREVFPTGPAIAPGEVLFVEHALPLLPHVAALALDEGDVGGGRAWLVSHDRLLAWGGATLCRAAGQCTWADYHRAVGQPDHARRHAEAAFAHATEPRQPLALLAAHRLLGELDTAEGRPGEAHGHLDAALALADACVAPYERALTLLALAELHAAVGERDAAREPLAEARAILVPLEAQPALARAETLAARLAAPAPAAPVPTALPFGLTAREAEILKLVAAGLGNVAIADRLSLSRRTVEQHLRSVYDKLGVENRTAAARVAVERGLA